MKGHQDLWKGAVRILNHSIKKIGLRYTNFISDGDSSAFNKVSESNPYPNKPVEKLECVGHIPKRIGAGLLSLVKGHQGIEGKGEGKLTWKVTNTLQNYYGMAIRNTKNTSIPKMKAAIAADFHHCTQKEEDDKDDIAPVTTAHNVNNKRVKLKVLTLKGIGLISQNQFIIWFDHFG